MNFEREIKELNIVLVQIDCHVRRLEEKLMFKADVQEIEKRLDYHLSNNSDAFVSRDEFKKLNNFVNHLIQEVQSIKKDLEKRYYDLEDMIDDVRSVLLFIE